MSKFTYTVRKDGRLQKTLTVKGQTRTFISRDLDQLKREYFEAKGSSFSSLADLSSVRMKDFALKWVELNSVGKEHATAIEYKSLVNSYIIPNLGLKKIKDIKILDIKELMKKMDDKPTTAKKTLQLIKRILAEAVDNDIVLKNVASNVKPPKIIKKERLPLTSEEDNALVKSTHKYAPFFKLMRYTGMRREEIIPLTKNDIDLENKNILINKAVTFVNSKPILKTTKNTKSRVVPLLDCIYDDVVELVHNTDDLIFTKETDGKMLTAIAVRRHLESFLYDLNKNRENKIKFTCHQLRHSYCTMLYYAGVKIKKAQELMGHSSADMVYNIYTHLDEQKENASSIINDYIEKTCQK